jgi:hypothetical protein
LLQNILLLQIGVKRFVSRACLTGEELRGEISAGAIAPVLENLILSATFLDGRGQEKNKD